MKSIFWVFTVCLPTSVFAGEIWCTDKAVWGSTVPDSGYSIRMGMLEGNGQYFPLVDRLFLSLQTLNQKIVVTVGKSGSPDATWSPIASTEGNQEVVLRLNRNALASRVFLDGHDFPSKKALESKEQYGIRLKKYVEDANGKPLIDAFKAKYGELLVIHCKVATVGS